jgi:hypothetical protein
MGTDKSCLPYCNFLLTEMTHNSHAFVQKNGSSGGGGEDQIGWDAPAQWQRRWQVS